VFFVFLVDIGRKTNERKVSKLLLLPTKLLLRLAIESQHDACDEELFSIDPSGCGTIGLRALLAVQGYPA